MDRNKRQLDSLMSALRHLAADQTAMQPVLGAKRAIWKCISEEVHEADRELFKEELRNRAIAEEEKVPSEREKLFWRDVAQYALAPIKPST